MIKKLREPGPIKDDNGEVLKYEPSQQMKDRIVNNFTYHAPKGNQPARYERIRNAGKELAEVLVRMCPESRELSLALTHLEDAIMSANAAIARNE